MAHTYKRIRFREDGTERVVILRDPTEVKLLGRSCLSGIEVNRHGNEIAPAGADERRRIIDMEALITAPTKLVMDNFYGELLQPVAR